VILNFFGTFCAQLPRVQILRTAYLSAGEFNPVLEPVYSSQSRGGSNSQLAKSTLRGYLIYPPLYWAFISFQKTGLNFTAER